MADISAQIQKIMSAIYGEEVRGSIRDALLSMNEEASNAMAYASTARNSAKDYAEAAKQYSGKPAISRDNTWWIWNADTQEYEDTKLKSSLVPAGEYDTTVQYERLDVVEHEGSSYLALRAVQGVTPAAGDDWMLLVRAGADGAPGADGQDGSSIASIIRTAGTGAPGTTDTYTVTLTDGSTSTFQVYNGKDGQGSGDMSKTVYDPQNKAQDIFGYVDEALKDIPAAENAITIPGGAEMVPPAGLGPGPYTIVMDQQPGSGGDSAPPSAADVGYDNTASGVEATTVQGAVDELAAGLAADGVPVGAVISFLALSAPAGYLICDGAAHNISDYPALSAFIAAQFGEVNYFGGDGETTFATPDMRNLFLRGYHGGAEEKLSRNIGVRQEGTEVPFFSSYGDPYNPNASNITFPYADQPVNAAPINYDKRLSMKDKAFLMNGDVSVYTAEAPVFGLQYIPRPVNMAVLYCIKAI